MRHRARAAALVAALALVPGCAPQGGPAPESAPDEVGDRLAAARSQGDPTPESAPGEAGNRLAAARSQGGPAPESAPDEVGEPREPGIHLATAPTGERTIDVTGLPAADLAHLEGAGLTREGWQALLRVRVATPDPAAAEPPPVLGDYTVAGGKVRFTPRFPFAAGQRYDVVFDPSSLPSARPPRPVPGAGPAPAALRAPRAGIDRSARVLPRAPRPLRTTVEVPAPALEPSTRVAAVYPTGPEVPENHLRLYIVFSAPMGLGAGGPHVRLLDEHGAPVADAFLPLDVDLWNADRTRYTVLYDPGRVKRGIRPNAELGRPLAADRRYTLVIDAAWRDAAGQPLVAPFEREYRVGPPRERALDPAAWRLDLPAPATRDPLAVRFPVPLDYGLLQSAIHVASDAGRPLAGGIGVDESETRWTFTPRAPWQPGEYRLVAAATLEDAAGNRIGRPFEVDAVDPQGAARARGAVVPFRIGRTDAAR